VQICLIGLFNTPNPFYFSKKNFRDVGHHEMFFSGFKIRPCNTDSGMHTQPLTIKKFNLMGDKYAQ
jgi:hypothetical protein